METETIVVDNQSSDGSPEAVEERYPWATCIRLNANEGFARANNIGMTRARGRYFLLVNSDVVILPSCVQTLTEHMDKNPAVGLAGPRLLSPDGSTQRSCMGLPTLGNTMSRALGLDALFPSSRIFGGQLLTHWGHDSSRDVAVINGAFWIARAEAVHQTGMLDPSFFMYGEDVDWCIRFAKAKWRVHFFPDARAIHYGGASSANAPVRYYAQLYASKVHCWQKHHGVLSTLAYRVILIAHHSLRAAIQLVLWALGPSGRAPRAGKLRRHAATLRALSAAR
jgi:GT2 family glycosyltransferase